MLLDGTAMRSRPPLTLLMLVVLSYGRGFRSSLLPSNTFRPLCLLL